MYSIFPWFLTSLFLISIGIGLAHNASKCGKGEYESDFLSGGCVKCPERLQDCINEQIDDARRCSIACGRALISTKPPFLSSTAVPQVKILVIADTTSTKNSTNIKNTISTQQIPDNGSSRNGYDKFMLSTSSSVVPNEKTGDSNNTIILLGVIFSLAGLICVVIVCFVFHCWWRRRGNTTDVQEPRCTYNAVTNGPIPNSEQNTSDALSSNTEDVAITMDPEP